jgi:hypothetical protein
LFDLPRIDSGRRFIDMIGEAHFPGSWSVPCASSPFAPFLWQAVRRQEDRDGSINNMPNLIPTKRRRRGYEHAPMHRRTTEVPEHFRRLQRVA